MSEFPPTLAAQSWTFVQRNRLIAGLAHALLVVEAQEKSGTMITVRAALEQGKEVLVVPQSLWNRNHSGIIRLANEGATVVRSATEVVTQVWPETTSSSPSIKVAAGYGSAKEDPPSVEQQILALVQEYQGQMLVTEIVVRCPRTLAASQWQNALEQLIRKKHWLSTVV